MVPEGNLKSQLESPTLPKFSAKKLLASIWPRTVRSQWCQKQMSIASWKLLEAFGKPLESLWELEASGRLWEAFGKPLESFWEPLETLLEASGNPFGSFWKPPGSHFQALEAKKSFQKPSKSFRHYAPFKV